MSAMRIVWMVLSAVMLASGFDTGPSSAETYPTKPIRVVVPTSPGGITDTLARALAQRLTESFGQQVIVENKPAGAGQLGMDFVAKAPPDGYTLLLANLGHAASVSLYRNLPYDVVRDFAPVTQLASAPAIVVAHPSLPVRSLDELVKLSKARPGAINYASGGVGTPTFVAAELFKAQAGVNLLHVPYRAGGEALTAVLSGEVSIYFSPLATALPHVRQGRLRPLAVTAAKRVPVLPEYPTVAELGYPGYQSGNWYGLLVPAKTPKEIIAAIRAAAVAALNNETISRRLADLGYVAIGDQPEEFAAHIKAEIESRGKILRESRITAE
jgi:tripartite-type tricarboxylate transporter receptor subunit TctC